MLALIRHQVYVYNAISTWGGRDIRIRDVTIYNTPGMGITGRFTHNYSLERVQIRKKGRRAINKSRRRRLKALAEALVGPRSRPTTVDKRRVRLKGYKWRRRRR